MKLQLVTAVGIMALMTGSAFADGGCFYGKHIAKSEAEKPALASAEQTDPRLLASLQEQEEAERLERLLETPVIHN